MAPAPALFTDRYEIAMALAYETEGMRAEATFEVAYRRLPGSRNYVVAAGLSDVLDQLEGFRVTDEEIDHLRSLGAFPDRFLANLRGLRFTGDVWAVPEGTVVFPHEPLLQLVAPLPVAQWVETVVLNQLHFQSVMASKAARVVAAAAGRPVIGARPRRGSGPQRQLSPVEFSDRLREDLERLRARWQRGAAA